MTEADWFAATEPAALLDALHDRLSERQLRLFACACCGRVDRLITDPQCRAAWELAERFVEGGVGPAELRAAHAAAQHAKPLFADANWAAAWAAAPPAAQAALQAALLAAQAVAKIAAEPARSSVRAAVYSGATHQDRQAANDRFDSALADARLAEHAAQADLLRDIAGNPFRPRPALDPAWLAWGGGTVTNLAEAIDREKAFDRLPILADALEEAGCDNAELLDHCRVPAAHARGCWLIGLLLDKR